MPTSGDGAASPAGGNGASGWGRRTSSSHSDVFSTSSTSRAFGGLQQSRRPTASSGSYLSRSKRSGSGWEFPGLGSLRSSSGQASPSAAGNGRFPRPSSIEQPPQSTFPPGNAGSAARSSSYRTGESSSSQAMRAGKPDGSDVERQGGAQDPAGSGISMEGRSYRFQPSFNYGEHDNLASSYTATSDSLRESTAQLAAYALGAEDGPSPRTSDMPTHLEDSREDTAMATSYGKTSVGPSTPSDLTGASNLTKALGASRRASPEGQRTLRAKDSANASPNLSFQASPGESLNAVTPKAGDRAPISTTLAEDEADTRLSSDAAPTENTPLIPRGRKASGSRDRDQSNSRSRSSASSRTRERSTSSHPDSGEGRGSSFNIREAQGKKGARTSYGYGVLAQASMAAEGGSLVSTAGFPDDSLEEPASLSAAWNVVPARWRPGHGERPTRECFSPTDFVRSAAVSMSKLTWRDVLDASAEPIRLLPATILGLLMNILDGVSYGLIIFPSSYPLFANFGGDGVSMFFVTCVIAQLTFTLGGSIFKGGNGSMMIEVVPFYHILCTTIIATIGDDNPKSIVATTMIAFALSSIFTGVAFLLLGLGRLGVLIGFFPRHILVGCIGGVGVFLLETGFEVAGRLEAEAGFQYDLATLKYFFQSEKMIALWGIPLLLAIVLKIIAGRIHHPLLMPGYFLAITPIFYLISVTFLGLPLDKLRYEGWIFDIGSAGEAPFWRYLTYLDFSQTSIRALWNTMPTMISLTFFSVLHVPLNVPALGVSLKEDNVDVDRELTGHGISNLIAGCFFTVPNYLCFSNSLLFYRVGGGNVLSGLMLAGATAVILVIGPGAINYLNVSTVGALIFLLGIDLCKEAVWDTIGRVNMWEYLTIWFIIIVMSLADFVIGILAGICLACLFLTIQMARRKSVRACFDGSIARSTVRRPMTQRKFLEAVGVQTQILKLQGFLFFATINSVEALIRKALDIATWQQKPMRFLVIDFHLVSGIDFSAAEAFTRIQRLLQAKDVVLVFCGLTPDSEVGRALRSVGLWSDCGLRIESFHYLNEALEWTENSYLRGMYASSLQAGKQLKQASLGADGALDVPDTKRPPAFVLDEAFENSPRRHHLHEAAKTAVKRGERSAPARPEKGCEERDHSHRRRGNGSDLQRRASAQGGAQEQPYPLLLVTFGAYASAEQDECFFNRLAKYFERVELLRGELVWKLGDEPDAMYLIERGALKARYDFEQEAFDLNEAMLAGTIAGELSFLSRQARNTTTRAELNSVLWKLDLKSLKRLEREAPESFSLFVALLLRVTGDEQENLMNYLVSRLS